MPHTPAASTTAATSVSQPAQPTSHSNGAASGKGDKTSGAQEKDAQEQQQSPAQNGWRDKLPGMLSGPLDALFPRVPPSLLCPSSSPPPSFLLAGASRTAWRSRKHLLRAMVVLLATFILVLNPDSLGVLGQASFFGMIVSVMLPPTFPAQVFLLVATMLVLGMCVGWAWGCAAMAAGLRARDQVLLASSLRRVQTGIAGATNPDSSYRLAIFRGEFLDARATVVFGVFMGVGLFLLGLMRAKAPKLMLVSIFASIVVDVMCSYGPLFPFAQYTLATTFLLPTACFIAIALAATVLIFPSTLNHVWTIDLVDKFLSPILQRSHLHSKLLSTPPPAFHDISESARSSSSPSGAPPTSPWQPFTALFSSTQEAAASGLEGLLGGIPMLELEVTFGKLGAKDLAGLVDALRELHVRSVGLGVLFSTVESRYKRYSALKSAASSDDASSSSSMPAAASSAVKSAAPPAYTETARMQRVRERMTTAERTNQHDLGSLLPLLERASSDLRGASDSALEGVMDWLISRNNSRWGFSRASSRAAAEQDESSARQKEQVAFLEAAIAAYRTDGRRAVVAPFRDFFDPATGELVPPHERSKDATFSPGSLFTLLAASDNLVVFAEAVLALAKRVAELDEKRRVNRVWWPTGLRKIGKLVTGGGQTRDKAVGDGENPDRIEVVGAEEEESEEEEEEGGKKKRARKTKKGKGKKEEEEGLLEKDDEQGFNPDARPPKNAFQRFTFGLYRFLHFFTTPDAVFALKYSFFSLCIWLPQIFSSTALIMYEEKSLWALIMFQTSLAIYSGDQILSSIQKLFGTAVGLVYGMLMWYLGSANGPGSPYGLGAAVFILMLPAMAIRIYAPLASSQVAIQAAVTSILIVGYSWQDSNLPSVGNPGIGYELAWKRALLVVIGTGIAAVAMLLPPVSTRLLVRRTHATCLNELGRLYTLIISEWLREEQRFRHLPPSEAPLEETPSSSGFSPAVRKAGRARMLAVRVKLNSTRAAIVQAGYEISLQGDWKAEENSQLLTLELALLQALAQLAQALVRLSPEWRRALVHETAFLNPPLIADTTSTFALLALALRQGSPLPQATPGPLVDRLLYHDRRLRLLSSRQEELPPTHPRSKSSSNDTDTASTPSAPEIEGARLSSSTLTFSALEDDRFGIYCSALQALASVLLDVDELEGVVKGLVGEIKFLGYEELVERGVYERV
ncbi:hypothetical protein JCM6882_003571 [Rhodosporidiobolus microsporus]